MELLDLLKRVEMFAGLSEANLRKLIDIFEEQQFPEDAVIFAQGDEAQDLYIVVDGFVEVIRESTEGGVNRSLVNLGRGQTFGEMALIDQGSRSATVRAVNDKTKTVKISRRAFEDLCENNAEIGFKVMRNIAADLSFRLRRRDT